ncbi:MAG: hypothetical protein IPL46_24410 [Saprospiraceae bacterium]|nr:hypothetical protein [Saprospiraceae bacterium]
MQAESAFGEWWSANITKHPDGLGRYSNGELAYLLRTGIQKNGTLNPFMLFPNLSDEDLGAVIGYLRSDNSSTQPSPVQRKTPDYSFLAKALFKLGAIKPFPFDEEPIIAPSKSDKFAYGKYLANSVFVCAECHSESFETFNYADPESSPGFFGGGNPLEDMDFVVVPSRNLTPHPTDGIGNWNLDQFGQAVQSGLRPDGSGISNAMPRFLLLKEDEIEAIWEYLKTVPSIENEKLAKGK